MLVFSQGEAQIPNVVILWTLHKISLLIKNGGLMCTHCGIEQTNQLNYFVFPYIGYISLS